MGIDDTIPEIINALILLHALWNVLHSALFGATEFLQSNTLWSIFKPNKDSAPSQNCNSKWDY
jgi:hypothetical protein